MEAQTKLIEKLKELVEIQECYNGTMNWDRVKNLRYEIASLDKQIAESETHLPEGYYEKKPIERYLGELPSKQIAEGKEIPAGAEENEYFITWFSWEISIDNGIYRNRNGKIFLNIVEIYEYWKKHTASIKVKKALQSNNLKNE